ncbi:MAG: ATP-binding protein [Frankiales bacterium]|nr:ATP-binding protein [Frankiales bacterium]
MTIGYRVVRALWTRAHNQCAFPSCFQALTEDAVDATTGDVFVTVVGEQAHIRSSKPNGPRHDSAYPKDKLDAYENLILLCPTHHKMIDDENGSGYTVEALEKMRRDHERHQERLEYVEKIVTAYVSEQYEFDDKVLFEQVDLNGPSVDSMFVDVPFACRTDSPVAELMTKIASDFPGDAEASHDADGQIVTGAAQTLLHPGWTSNALLIGGPGQGKSTVLQYVSQFHRARLLGKDNYSGEALRLQQLTDVVRVPIRIDLRRYASWAAKKQHERPREQRRQQQTGSQRGRRRQPQQLPQALPWPSIDQYMLVQFREHGGGNFTRDDLVAMLAARPVLLALDGLDEVANLEQREAVSDAIVRANAHLRVGARDLVVLVATRPGAATTNLWSSTSFPQLRLRRLSQGLRLQYLQQWADVAGLSEESAHNLQRTFMDNQHIAHIQELAAYPMQLAILLHLLHRRRLLPQQRTELYDDYLQTFLDREQTHEKEPLLADERKVIEDIHAYLGWHIQTEVERGRSSGSIKRDELKKLLRLYLADREDGPKLAAALFNALTSRVLCLIERETGKFEFEVQSLREYFAAVHIFGKANPKLRDDCLAELLRRPYWSNVVRFYVGKYSDGEVRGMQDVFDQLSHEPNFRYHPLLRSTAALFLNDRTYHGLNDTPIQHVVDFILDGPGVVLAHDGLLDVAGSNFQLSDRAGRAQAVVHLKKRLEHETSTELRDAVAASLRRHATEDDKLADWWWKQHRATWAWLRTAAQLGVLRNLTERQHSQVLAVIGSEHSDSEWATEILSSGGYLGASDWVLEVVAAEINDGAADVISSATPGSAIGHLLSAASHAQQRPRPNRSSHSDDRSRTRVRNKAGRGVLSRMAEAEQQLRTHSTHEASARDWKDRLTLIEATWGEGWVLRQAVAGVPLGIDLAGMASTLTNATLKLAVSSEAGVREHRGDTEWWRNALRAAPNNLAQRHWTFSLVTAAHTSVLVELQTELNTLVDALSPKHYAVLRAGVQAQRTRPSGRLLSIADALRLKKVVLSNRVLWLIRVIASEGSVEQIDKKTSTEIAPLLRPGSGDMRDLVRIVSPRKLDLGEFHDARSTLPIGGWASSLKLGPWSNAATDAVLGEPDHWPSDIVQRAAERVEDRMNKRLAPLVTVAEENRWFD